MSSNLTEKLMSLFLNKNNLHGFTCGLANFTQLLNSYNLNILVYDELKQFTQQTTHQNNEFSTFSSTTPELDVSKENAIRTDYDYNEAIIYIIFVLFWYSIGIVGLIRMDTQTNALNYHVDEDDTHLNSAHNLLRQRKGESIKREALEHLRNPEFTKKLWDIYLQNPNTYKIRRFEMKRMQQIDRKLKQYPHTDHYRTIDSSLLESNRNKYKLDTNLLLFRDMNRIENPNVQSTIQPQLFSPQSNAISNLSMHQSQNSNNNSSVNEEAKKNNNVLKSRFKIERIQENV